MNKRQIKKFKKKCYHKKHLLSKLLQKMRKIVDKDMCKTKFYFGEPVVDFPEAIAKVMAYHRVPRDKFSVTEREYDRERNVGIYTIQSTEKVPIEIFDIDGDENQ